jgi:hypothetical protein
VTRPDLPTLVSGLTIAALGIVLLLDQVGGLSLSFGSLAPLVLTVVGLILLVGGLARRDNDGETDTGTDGTAGGIMSSK